MPFTAPSMPCDWERVKRERADAEQRAMEKAERKASQLPSYSQATSGQKIPELLSEKQEQKPKKDPSNSKMAALKSILMGDVHKHNARFVMAEAVTGQPSEIRKAQQASQAKRSSSNYYPMHLEQRSITPQL